ncbi:hypothetical protein J0695_19240, partial [Streptomyces beijiangensis]|nr:hypothetical protein [Streptomyces beijiangensis]
MRISPKAGYLVSSAVCGALVLGAAGPAAYAAVSDAPAHSATASVVPVPGADALAGQTALLGNAAGVLKPVTDLIDAVLKAPDGKLPAADADTLAASVKEALAKVTAAAPAAPAVPAVPAAPAVPAVPAVP